MRSSSIARYAVRASSSDATAASRRLRACRKPCMFITSPNVRRSGADGLGPVASGRITSTARALIASAPDSSSRLDAMRACVLMPSARPTSVVSERSPSSRILPSTSTASSMALRASASRACVRSTAP